MKFDGIHHKKRVDILGRAWYTIGKLVLPDYHMIP